MRPQLMRHHLSNLMILPPPRKTSLTNNTTLNGKIYALETVIEPVPPIRSCSQKSSIKSAEVSNLQEQEDSLYDVPEQTADVKTLQEQDSQKDSLYDVPEKTADVITLREQDSREQVPEEVGIIPSESKSKHLAIKLPESNKSPFPPTPISASIPIGAIIEMYKSDNNLLTQPRKQSLPKIVPFARFTGYIAPKNKTLSAITSLTDSYTGIIHKRTKTSLLRVVKLERRMIVLANCTLYVFKDLDSKSIYNEHVRDRKSVV